MMLQPDQFLLLGSGGFGNRRSGVAHSMAWFQDRLYLGLTHARGEGPLDAARILRFDPERVEWDTVHRSELVNADARVHARDVYRGRGSELRHARADRAASAGNTCEVPLDRGYRSMVVFQGNDDAEPALYVGTLSQLGAALLRSRDGEQFTRIAMPTAARGVATTLSFRGLTCLDGKLFAAPAGKVDGESMDRNFGERPELYVTENPEAQGWRSALPEDFGDPGDRSIFSMTVFDQQLYISTGNPERGFSLWRTRALGEPPFDWERVLVDGAGRYNLNETAATLCSFGGALYIGSGLPGLGHDRANDVGPAAFELLRLLPNDQWDLLVGTPRFTPQGLKVPLAAQGPGFDDPFNSVVWAMAAHEGCLYVGTHQWEPFAGALRGDACLRGGYQLWASEDGESWIRLLDQGHGDPFQTGIRTLLSTPIGLAVGTTNHQEIERRWRRSAGLPPASGQSGGCAVLLGLPNT